MPIITLFSIILLEGFVTISVEILSIRQLLPFVGNSVIVTSLIIGIFLLFLALGYLRGGKYTDGYRFALKNNFTKAAVLIGIGLSYTFTALFFQLGQQFFPHSMLLILSLYLFAIIAPVVYILGQTVPITTNLFLREKHVGAISGKVLYLSTLGSFLGAVLTSLLLLNFLGVAWTVVINSAVLFVLIIMMSELQSSDLWRIFALGLSMVFIVTLNITLEKSLFLKTNNFANYALKQDFPIRPNQYGDAFIINNSLSSFLDNQKKGAPYVEKIKTILFNDLQLSNKNILVLGAGGFTLSAQGQRSNHFTYVDIDKDIDKVVQQHFLKKINGRFIAADARVFVKDHKAEFDVIISDVFKSQVAIPAYLLTREYFQDLKAAIKPGGFAIFNFILNPLLNDNYSKHVDSTVNQVFHNCMKLPLDYRQAYQNVLYLCHLNKKEYDTISYTDNMNRATLDFFNANR